MSSQLPARASLPSVLPVAVGFHLRFQQLHPPAAPEAGMTVASTSSLFSFLQARCPLLLSTPLYLFKPLISPQRPHCLKSLGWWGLVTADTGLGQYLWVVFTQTLHSKREREEEAQFTRNNCPMSQKNMHLKHRQMYKAHVDFWPEFCFQPVGIRREPFSGTAAP